MSVKSLLGRTCLAALCLSLGVTSWTHADTLTVTPLPGYTLNWNGPSGPFDNNNPGTIGDGQAPNGVTPDRGLSSLGVTAFASSLLTGYTQHQVSHLNDSTFGNSNSWIPDPNDPNPSAGLDFTTAAGTLGNGVRISEISFSRNESNPAFNDRYAGTYTLQFTDNPSSAAIEAGALVGGGNGTMQPGTAMPTGTNPLTNWVSIGSLNYDTNGSTPGFNGALSNFYSIGGPGGLPIQATAFRLLVPNVGGNFGTAVNIDELRAFGAPTPEPSTFVLAALGVGTLFAVRRRRQK